MKVGEETESISGCQSGWTVYFDQSYLALKKQEELGKEKEQTESEEDDDSLSMVSDASSGPPHLDLEEVGCLCTASSSPSNANATLCDINLKKRKVDQFLEMKKQQDFSSPFDDTASSLLIYNSNNGVEIETMDESASDFSCSFSSTNMTMYSVKKMKRRYCDDTFPSFSSIEQPVQDFL